MIRLVYGTGNPAKLGSMRRSLAALPIELIGLSELAIAVPDVEETGRSPLENAITKARAYHAALGCAVFSCDSGLYCEGLPDALQPGVHVRHVNGRVLTDEEMTAYYAGLAHTYGELVSRYRNAICLITADGREHTSMAEELSGERFLICDTPHKKRVAGFPLDCLSKRLDTREYYYDRPKQSVTIETGIEAGFRRFFTDVLQGTEGWTEESDARPVHTAIQRPVV